MGICGVYSSHSQLKQKDYETNKEDMAISEKDSFVRKIDDKRRFALPIEVRDEFSSGVVVTRGRKDFELYLYSKDFYQKYVEPKFPDVDNFDIMDDASMDKMDKAAQLRMGKLDVEADKKYGRITLTNDLHNFVDFANEIEASRPMAGQAYFHIFPK